MSSTQGHPGRAGVSKSLRTHRQPRVAAPQPTPRQSLDDSEEAHDFDTILSRGFGSPTMAMGKWLCDLPSVEELGPNEHFAVGEYDDDNGYRRSAMFVYESVGEKQQQSPGFLHPRTPPLPSTVPTDAFTPYDFLKTQPPQNEPRHHSSFRITALNSVGSGKIILKRFAKTAGRVLEQLTVMPDYSSPRSGPSISLPFKSEGKRVAFDTISIQEAQAREKARRANYLRQQTQQSTTKPLERVQVGSRETLWEDFLTYQSQEQIPQPQPPSPRKALSPPRIPDRINRPSRKPLPTNAPAVNLDKSLPSIPDTDSLRRRTPMPLGVLAGERPDILAVPANRVVVSNHRNAVVSQYGLVLESSEASLPERRDDEPTVWSATPVELEPPPKKQRLWWQFEGSSEELDPTQAVWKRVEEELRSGGGIRVAAAADPRCEEEEIPPCNVNMI